MGRSLVPHQAASTLRWKISIRSFIFKIRHENEALRKRSSKPEEFENAGVEF